jgi:hypothetical protein
MQQLGAQPDVTEPFARVVVAQRRRPYQRRL